MVLPIWCAAQHENPLNNPRFTHSHRSRNAEETRRVLEQAARLRLQTLAGIYSLLSFCFHCNLLIVELLEEVQIPSACSNPTIELLFSSL